MKICQIMAGDEEGGLETHFVDMANGLAALGEEVTAIGHGRYRERFDQAVRFLSLDLTRSRRNPFLRRRLRQLIDDERPQLVHAQGGKAADLLAALRPAARTVGTIHGVKKDLSAYRRFDAVIGVSRGVLEGLSHPREFVVYNGVRPPPSALSRAELCRRFALPEHHRITLAIGRLVPVKGYPRLIELWRSAFGHLLIVGEGPQRPLLQRLAADKPVVLAGHQADARALMGAADLMVFASEREGFSYAFAEALMARLPVVSTPVPGAAELLPSSHLATPDRLPDAIARCLADPAVSRQRLADLFAWAAETLTVERMVRATREVYRAVV